MVYLDKWAEEAVGWFVDAFVNPEKKISGIKNLKKDLAVNNKASCETSKAIDDTEIKVAPFFSSVVDFATYSQLDFRAVKVKECKMVPNTKRLLKFVLDDGSGKNRVIISGIHEYYEPESLVGKTCVAAVNSLPKKIKDICSCGILICAVYEYDGHEILDLLVIDDNIPAGAKLY